MLCGPNALLFRTKVFHKNWTCFFLHLFFICWLTLTILPSCLIMRSIHLTKSDQILTWILSAFATESNSYCMCHFFVPTKSPALTLKNSCANGAFCTTRTPTTTLLSTTEDALSIHQTNKPLRLKLEELVSAAIVDLDYQVRHRLSRSRFSVRRSNPRGV